MRDFKKHSNASPEEFLNLVIEKLGYNTYLKSAIQEALDGSNDRIAQAKTLLTELQSL